MLGSRTLLEQQRHMCVLWDLWVKHVRWPTPLQYLQRRHTVVVEGVHFKRNQWTLMRLMAPNNDFKMCYLEYPKSEPRCSIPSYMAPVDDGNSVLATQPSENTKIVIALTPSHPMAVPILE
eukprot:PhF_6_TR43605/c0_g1_i2/m.66975